MVRGKCNAPGCDNDARTGASFYCQSHTVEKTNRKKSTRKAAEPEATIKDVVVDAIEAKPSRSSKAPSQNEWDALLVPIIVFITSAFVVGALQHRDQPGLTAEEKQALRNEQDRLSLTDEDAAILAKPITRLISSSSINEQWGRKIMENADVVMALYVLWEWQNKLKPYLREKKEYKQTGKIAEKIFYNGMNTPPAPPVYQRPPQDIFQAQPQPQQNEGESRNGTPPPTTGPTLDDGEYGQDPHPPWYYQQ